MNTQDKNDILEITQYKQRLSVALKAAKICVFEVDLQKQLYTFFENAEDIFKVSGSDILNDVLKFSQLQPELYQQAVINYFSHPDDFPIIDKAFKLIFSGHSTSYEARMRAGGSNFIWCKLDVSPIMENGVPSKMIGVITDISNIKKKTDNLIREIQLDNFTGLYNKKYAQLFIEEILATDTKQPHAMVLIDIDDFKKFNDTFGHAEGDKIIKINAEHIKKVFINSDIVSRFGGDEFLVFIKNFNDIDLLLKRLNSIVKNKYYQYNCTNSIGVAISPQNGTTIEELFNNADKALYHSKLTKSTFTFFSDIVK